MRALLAGIAAFLLTSSAGAQAPSYGGTYVSPNPTGPITLVLTQDASGKMTGTWTAGGTVFQANGLRG